MPRTRPQARGQNRRLDIERDTCSLSISGQPIFNPELRDTLQITSKHKATKKEELRTLGSLRDNEEATPVFNFHHLQCYFKIPNTDLLMVYLNKYMHGSVYHSKRNEAVMPGFVGPQTFVTVLRGLPSAFRFALDLVMKC